MIIWSVIRVMTATTPVQELNGYVLIYSSIPFRNLFATLNERHTYSAKWTNFFFDEIPNFGECLTLMICSEYITFGLVELRFHLLNVTFPKYTKWSRRDWNGHICALSNIWQIVPMWFINLQERKVKPCLHVTKFSQIFQPGIPNCNYFLLRE